MLGKYWRLVAKNSTGVALTATDTIAAYVTRWKIGADGSRLAESSAVNVFPSTAGNSLANGAFADGTTQDNTAAGAFWFGTDILWSASVNTATPNGNIELYYQTSHDGSAWPTNGEGELIDTLNFTVTGAKQTSLSL